MSAIVVEHVCFVTQRFTAAACLGQPRLPQPERQKKKVSLLTNDAFTAPELHVQSHHYLILAEISPQSLYVLGCVADLRGQTRGISHLGVFLVNIFHFSEGLAEERREKKGTRKGRESPD